MTQVVLVQLLLLQDTYFPPKRHLTAKNFLMKMGFIAGVVRPRTDVSHWYIRRNQG